MTTSTAVLVSNLSKRYHLSAIPALNLREGLGAGLKKIFAPNNTAINTFWALREISFEIKKGESLGIIGHNGAGKSTLLKILSRITPPTKGRIEINGRVSSLLEVGTGFHSELTGKENVYLNGAILGMTRKEIKAKFDAIVAFSGVEKFIDMPVKHYSSGMKVRLAFSVAAYLEPEILIIDEVLAVGDAEFQKKCLGKMEDVTADGRTVIFVSHNLGAVSKLCSRAMLLEQGKAIFTGNTPDTINRYQESISRTTTFQRADEEFDKDFMVKKVFVTSIDNKIKSSFAHDQAIVVNIEFLAKVAEKKMNICISVYNHLQKPIFTSDVPLLDFQTGDDIINMATVKIPSDTLTSGNYSFLVAIHNPSRGVGAIDYLPYICPISVFDNGSEFAKYDGVWDTGDVFVNCDWEFSTK